MEKGRIVKRYLVLRLFAIITLLGALVAFRAPVAAEGDKHLWGVDETVGLTKGVEEVDTPQEVFLVHGHVWDGGSFSGTGHVYGLYSRINISAPGFSGVVFSDPLTGYFEAEFTQPGNYIFSVEAFIAGYSLLEEPVSVDKSTIERDFFMVVAGECAAPGYGNSSSAVLREGFDSGSLPTFWTNRDYQGNGQVWQFNDPGGRDNLTPGANGGFAILDSDYYPSDGHQNAGLRTPVLNLTGVTGVSLAFDSHYRTSSSTPKLRVSGDNGATWTTVWTTIPDTSGRVSLDISAQAAGRAQVIVEFQYIGWDSWYWEIDDVAIDKTICAAKDGGVVAGYVRDGNTGQGLIGATVRSTHVNTKSISVPDDPAHKGLYWLFEPQTASQAHTFTASMERFGDSVQSVLLQEHTLIQQDFTLTAGMLSIAPHTLAVTMRVGAAARSETLTVSNIGGRMSNFELVEAGQKMIPKTSALNAEGSIQAAEAQPAYAVDVINNDLMYMPDVNTPGIWTKVGDTPKDIYAGDITGGDNTLFYAAGAEDNKLYQIDLVTGYTQTIGTAVPPGGQTWSGLSGTAMGTLYALSTSSAITSLSTINTQTAAVNVLGTLTGVKTGIDLAYNEQDGQIYVVDISSDKLFKVDPTTMLTTAVGSLGVDAMWAQGMDFDEKSGALYWAADTSAGGEMRLIDIATGASSMVGTTSNHIEVDCLAIVSLNEWLSEEPVGGSLVARGLQEVTIGFDPTGAGLDLAGEYSATLRLKHDTPYGYEVIRIVLNLVKEESIYLPIILH